MTTTAQGSGGTRRVFDGDATVDAVLGASGLPRELQDLVRLVVSRCRLSKRERSQAAAMLCDRFAEQLQAGRTVQQITGELGEPRVVARSLSRDVRRNRSLSVRIFRRGVQGVVLCVLLLIAAYGYYFVRFNFGKPNIARNFAQEHNDRVLARPESERAWPIYRQLLPGWKHLTYTKEEGTDGYPALKPGTPGWEAAVANLNANAAALEAIRRAAKLPALGCPLRDSPDPFVEHWTSQGASGGVEDSPASVASNPVLIDVLLRHLGIMRSFARALKFDALVAAERGDGRRVVDDLAAMAGLGHQLRDSEFLIVDLVGIALYSMAVSTTGELLEQRPGVFTDAQLVELASMLSPAARSESQFRVRFSIERQQVLDLLQRTYSDDGSGDGVLVSDGLRFFDSLGRGPMLPGTGTSAGLATLGPVLSAVTAGRAETWSYYDNLVRAAEQFGNLPLWERQEHLTEPGAGKHQILRMRLFLAEVMVTAFEKATIAPEFVLQDRDAIRVAIALEQYRRAKGAWPAALRDLVPAYLPEVPPDRYNGKPLGYVLVNGKPRIYSVGRDRIDDGGKLPTGVHFDNSRSWISPTAAAAQLAQLQSGKRVPGLEDFRGDWILWPEPSETDDKAAPAPSTEPAPAAPAG